MIKCLWSLVKFLPLQEEENLCRQARQDIRMQRHLSLRFMRLKSSSKVLQDVTELEYHKNASAERT